jgi:hypothetical protein
VSTWARWRRTWGEAVAEDLRRERWSWRVSLSTGIDAFSLGIVVKRPLDGKPFILGVALVFVLLEIEVWP